MARRSYQTGCLFKRGKRKQVWVGRYREEVTYTDGSRGRRQRSVVLGLVSEVRSRREAQTLLDQRLRPLNRGDHRPQSTMSFTEFAEGEWMSLVVPTLKLTTQRGYRLTLRRHVWPHLGRWRLCDLTKLDVQRFVGEKFQDQLAWQTVRNIWTVTSAVLEAAVEYGYLKENVARGVKFPPRSPATRPHRVACGRVRGPARSPERAGFGDGDRRSAHRPQGRGTARVAMAGDRRSGRNP